MKDQETCDIVLTLTAGCSTRRLPSGASRSRSLDRGGRRVRSGAIAATARCGSGSCGARDTIEKSPRVELTEPGWNVMFDADPEQDRSTRRALLDRLEAEQTVFAASHLPEPAFGRIVRENGRRYWQSLPREGSVPDP
jgi:hypothetical protein